MKCVKLLWLERKHEAEEIDELLVGLHKDLFLEANPIPVKWAVGKQGLIEDGIGCL